MFPGSLQSPGRLDRPSISLFQSRDLFTSKRLTGRGDLKDTIMQIIHHQHPLENVHSVERWASVIGGSALAISGLRHGRSGVLRALTGVAFVRRGLTGYCPA